MIRINRIKLKTQCKTADEFKSHLDKEIHSFMENYFKFYDPFLKVKLSSQEKEGICKVVQNDSLVWWNEQMIWRKLIKSIVKKVRGGNPIIIPWVIRFITFGGLYYSIPNHLVDHSVLQKLAVSSVLSELVIKFFYPEHQHHPVIIWLSIMVIFHFIMDIFYVRRK